MSVVVALRWGLSMAMLDTRDVLVILDQLDRAGLVVWLDGGWGVDALLGRRSRHHQDLDLIVARHDCAVAREALAGLGFRHDLAAVPGLPARLVLVDAGGRIQVRCLTPQLQVHHHLGYPLGATDRHDLGLLAERFGVAVPPAIEAPAGDHRPDRSSGTP
jgi:hypothetical protein